MIFGVSIGCVWGFLPTEKNRDHYITSIRENFSSDINAIEIIMDSDNFRYFELSNENKKWLQSLDYISFHLPAIYTEKQWEECSFIIDNIGIDFKVIICHIDKKKKLDFEFLSHYGDKIIYENIENYFNQTLKEKQICFDVSHLLVSHSLESIRKIDSECIKEIHLSNYANNICHIPFHNNRKNDLHLIKMEIDLKRYPIIVEVNFENLEEMKQEIKFLKENL